jgi:hypothetical protein
VRWVVTEDAADLVVGEGEEGVVDVGEDVVGDVVSEGIEMSMR